MNLIYKKAYQLHKKGSNLKRNRAHPSTHQANLEILKREDEEEIKEDKSILVVNDYNETMLLVYGLKT